MAIKASALLVLLYEQVDPVMSLNLVEGISF